MSAFSRILLAASVWFTSCVAASALPTTYEFEVTNFGFIQGNGILIVGSEGTGPATRLEITSNVRGEPELRDGINSVYTPTGSNSFTIENGLLVGGAFSGVSSERQDITIKIDEVAGFGVRLVVKGPPPGSMLNVVAFSGIISSFEEVESASVVPLPASIWLLLSGLAGLGFVRRRQKLVA